MADQGQTSSRLSSWRLSAFALPCLPLSALGLPLVVYLPEYYANDLGLNLSIVGAAFMLVRIADIMVDPFLGAAMDRSRSRFGRFRPAMVIGAPLLALGTYMLFMAQKGIGPLYLFFWLSVTYFAYSLVVLGHTAWASVLSADYNQRSRIYSFWQVGNIIGMLLVLALPTLLEQIYGTSHAQGMQSMGWFIVILLPFAIGIAARTVGEPILTTPPKPSGISEYLGLLRSSYVRQILIVDLAMGLAPGITSALFFFFFEQVKGLGKGEAGILLLCYFMAGLAGAPVWNAISKKIGKHKTLAIACVLYAVTQSTLVLLPERPEWLLVVCLIAAGLPYSAPMVMLRAMMADVGDAVRLESGADRTGLLYALLWGTSKIGYALAVGTTFIGLDLIGFHAASGSQNSASALLGLQLFYAGVPSLLGLFAALILLGYRLDGPRHAEIRAALALRDGADNPEGPNHEPKPA